MHAETGRLKFDFYTELYKDKIYNLTIQYNQSTDIFTGHISSILGYPSIYRFLTVSVLYCRNYLKYMVQYEHMQTILERSHIQNSKPQYAIRHSLLQINMLAMEKPQ